MADVNVISAEEAMEAMDSIPLGITGVLAEELAKTDLNDIEAVKEAIVVAKPKGKPKTYEEILASFLPKLQEQGWYSVAEGRYTPQLRQEILFVSDKRSIGGSVKVKHGYVKKVGFDSQTGRWYIECTTLRVNSVELAVKLENGNKDDIVLWKPMLEAPRLPKLPKGKDV
jgi:hypothetical protein